MKRNDSNHPTGHGSLLHGLLLAAAIGLGPAAVFAATSQDMENGSLMSHMHGHSSAAIHAHFEEVLTNAGATASQKQRIDQLVRAALRTEHADMAGYHATASMLKTLLIADPIDETAVERLRAEQDRLVLDASRTLSDTAVQVAKVLTPTQRQAIGARIDQMMAGAEHHHDQ